MQACDLEWVMILVQERLAVREVSVADFGRVERSLFLSLPVMAEFDLCENGFPKSIEKFKRID